MANDRKVIDEFAVKDLEDGSSLKIMVESCSELGNESKPGLQLHYMGNIVCYEPLAVEKWAYQASKKGVTNYLLEDRSWMVHQDQFVKTYLVIASPPKARVEVKTRSKKEPVVKEYDLPFEIPS